MRERKISGLYQGSKATEVEVERGGKKEEGKKSGSLWD